jgi:PEP-CTERM motif-containing protein
VKRNTALWSICCLITALVWPWSAAADTITVTGGSLQVATVDGQLNLVGERGFFLTSHVITANGFYAPRMECGANICLPGDEVSLRAAWGGSDLSGQLGFEGKVYGDLGGAESFAGALVDFTGSFIVPPFAPTATVTAPFQLNGFFSIPNAAGTGSIQHILTGFGTATITMRLGEFQFVADAARYDLSSQQLVPEPGTMLMVGFGTVVIVRRLKRRHSGLSQPAEQPEAARGHIQRDCNRSYFQSGLPCMPAAGHLHFTFHRSSAELPNTKRSGAMNR